MMNSKIATSILVILLAACSTATYHYETFDATALSPQARTQTAVNISVTAAVPGRQQAAAIFGFPIYDSGIQPVWLSIRNESKYRIRYAHTGTGRRNPLEQILLGARFDPDMDDGRNYMMQNLWYSQGLKQIAWVDWITKPIDARRLKQSLETIQANLNS